MSSKRPPSQTALHHPKRIRKEPIAVHAPRPEEDALPFHQEPSTSSVDEAKTNADQAMVPPRDLSSKDILDLIKAGIDPITGLSFDNDLVPGPHENDAELDLDLPDMNEPHVEIPLRNQKGEIVAHARVSVCDAEAVNQRKWSFTRGYVQSTTSSLNEAGQRVSVEQKLHYFIAERMGLKPDPATKRVVLDHRLAGGGLDNRRCNLRYTTREINSHNVKKRPGRSSSFRGVEKGIGKDTWVGRISRTEFRSFRSEQAAAWWWDEAAKRLYGQLNGVTKPDNSDTLAIPYKPRRKGAMRGIQVLKGSSRFYVNDATGKALSFRTIEAARKFRDERDNTKARKKADELAARPITRDENGVAYLETTGKHKKRVLVDDDIFREFLGQSVVADQRGKEFYIRVRIQGKLVYLHRYITGNLDEGAADTVDHIDHNPCNNQRKNLRDATQEQNSWNKAPRKGDYKGVSLTPSNRWKADVRHQGIAYYIGIFSTQELAAYAYNCKAKELFGSFAYLNQVPVPEKWTWNGSRLLADVPEEEDEEEEEDEQDNDE
jgi:hypothetical protein